MPLSAEPEPTPEKVYPEPNPEPEKEPPVGEPGPEWGMARKTWGAAWDVHWTGLAVLFALLTLFAIFCLVRIYRRKRKSQVMAKFSVTVTVVISLFTSTRFLYLILNPYESPYDCLFGNKKCPLFINRFLFSVGLPSLLSAYFLLFLALHDVVKMKKIGKFNRLQNWWFLIGFVLFNYIFACAADIVVAYNVSAKLFLGLCQGYFIIYNLCLVTAFLYAGTRIYLTNRKTKSQILRLSVRHPTTLQTGGKKGTVQKVVRLAIVTSVIGLFYLGLQIYALAFVFAESYAGKSADPWVWLTYQYLDRLVELALATTILYNISYLPKKTIKRDTSQRTTTCSRLKFKDQIAMGNSITTGSICSDSTAQLQGTNANVY